MRRNDREISSHSEISGLIERCDVCRLGLAQNNIPYVVPLSFGHEFVNEQLILYFHGAGEGKKLSLIQENPAACFEMDRPLRVVGGEKACNYTREYESIIGHGHISICHDLEEKRRGALLLMKRYAPDKEYIFSDQDLSFITVFKLCASNLTGKRNLRPSAA